MGIMRKPWLIVFLAILAFYTYKVLSTAGSFSVAPSSAQAEPVEAKNVQAVDLQQSVELSGEKLNLLVKAFATMSISIVEGTPGENLELILSGKGQRYLRQGSQMEDWLKVSVSGKTIKIASALQPLKKAFNFWSNSNDLDLKILVPGKEALRQVDLNTVSGDILLSGLVLEDLKVRGVSGDCSLKRGSAKSMVVRTVSGDVESSHFSSEAVNVKSVSGDVRLEAGPSDKPSLQVKTVSGDLRLQLPQGASSPAVKFKSFSGELTNPLKNTSGVHGALEFSSVSGDANIFRREL